MALFFRVCVFLHLGFIFHYNNDDFLRFRLECVQIRFIFFGNFYRYCRLLFYLTPLHSYKLQRTLQHKQDKCFQLFSIDCMNRSMLYAWEEQDAEENNNKNKRNREYVKNNKTRARASYNISRKKENPLMIRCNASVFSRSIKFRIYRYIVAYRLSCNWINENSWGSYLCKIPSFLRLLSFERCCWFSLTLILPLLFSNMLAGSSSVIRRSPNSFGEYYTSSSFLRFES